MVSRLTFSSRTPLPDKLLVKCKSLPDHRVHKQTWLGMENAYVEPAKSNFVNYYRVTTSAIVSPPRLLSCLLGDLCPHMDPSRTDSLDVGTDCKQTSGSGLTTYYLAPKEEVWVSISSTFHDTLLIMSS